MQKVCETAAVRLDTMTMKVERAARQLINLLISTLDTDIVLESAAVSGRATPATSITITIPKKEDIAELDLKPGTVEIFPVSHTSCTYMCAVFR